MFTLIDRFNKEATLTCTEKDEQIMTLEAFQGDSALIQTVNELNLLKINDDEPNLTLSQLIQ